MFSKVYKSNKKVDLNKPLSSSASGKWYLFTHAHQGTIEVSKSMGLSLLDDSGLSWSHFLLLASESYYARLSIRNQVIPELSGSIKLA